MTKTYYNDKDPWTGKDKNNGGPPELDEVLRKLKRKFNSRFGGGKGNLTGQGGPSSGGIWAVIILVVILLGGLWFLSGLYKVSPAEKGVVLRFGKYDKTVGPGLHWVPTFIESVNIVNVKRVWQYTYESEMLTQDENIVSAKLTVQYRIDNPKDYLFNVIEPKVSLQQATKSALRQVVGHTKLEQILTTGREQVRDETSKQLTKTLNRYETGLEITDVTLQDANPPKEVVDAFDDAVKAREDARRFVNKAQAYRSEVIPEARGKASRIEQAAQGFKQKVQLRARADIQPFLAVKDVYRKAPEVTRYRIYMDSLEHALQGSKKIMLDNTANKPAFYMPMPGLNSKDQVRNNKQGSNTVSDSGASSDNSGGTGAGSDTQGSMSSYAKRPSGYPQRGSY